MESPDECFPYSPEDPPTSGRWQISALDLPEGVLRQVYADNARRPIPSLAATGEPAAPYRRSGPPRPGRRPLKQMSLAVGAPGGRHSAHGSGADPLRSGNARRVHIRRGGLGDLSGGYAWSCTDGATGPARSRDQPACVTPGEGPRSRRPAVRFGCEPDMLGNPGLPGWFWAAAPPGDQTGARVSHPSTSPTWVTVAR
jgi:hypothetical protein